MKRFLLFSLFQFVCCITLLYAQNEPEKSSTIINILESNGNSKNEGTIHISSDPKISSLIGKIFSSSGESQVIKMSGYRIQVFSGNTRNSKDEALSKEKQIKELYFDLPTYTTYRPPVWKLRVGDFRTREEAVIFMQELKKSFPAFQREMMVFPDEIKVHVNN